MRRLALPLSVLLLAGCSGSEERAPKPPSSWRTELSTAPTLLALTDSDVYAASFGNGVGGSQVYRVDRSAGRKVAQRTLAGEPYAMALGPRGELWLATVKLPDQPSGTGLQVLDPSSLQTRRSLPLEFEPLSVAFAHDALWVGDERGAHELDPATGAVLRSVRTQHPAYRLLVVGASLLAVGPQGMQRVDPVAGAAGPARALPAAGSVTATADERRVWVVHPDAQARAVLARYEPTALAPVATADSPGQAGAAAHLAEVLWVADPGGRRLLCADPDTGRVRAVREVAVTGPVVADGRTVVVAQQDGLAGLPAACGD